MDTASKSEIVQKHQKKAGDTGSVEVQAAILTQRILDLTEHLKLHHKDHSTRRGLLQMVSKRRKLLKYLQLQDSHRYKDLIESLGLRR